MVNFFLLLMKIFICLLIFIIMLLIIPVKYLSNINIGDKTKIYFQLSYLFGIIKFEYKSAQEIQFKIFCININLMKKKGRKINPKNDIEKRISDKIFSLYKKSAENNFNFDNMKPLLSPTLKFIKDVMKKIHPSSIEINGQIGFNDPANTGYICAIINIAAYILNINPNINYNFQNEILDLNFILRGKTRALLFIFIMIKYLRDEHVFLFIKNNFICKEVY